MVSDVSYYMCVPCDRTLTFDIVTLNMECDDDHHLWNLPYPGVFVYSRLSNFSAIRRLQPLQMTGLQIKANTYTYLLWLLAARVLGLFSLIRRTDIHVPWLDSYPWRKLIR
jgi:hypothetical protein